MAKYGYDKALLKGLGVGKFLRQVEARQAEIEKAGTELPSSVYAPNRLAARLHPAFLLGKIREANDLGAAMHYVIEPFREAGFTRFPIFRPGQYISVEFNMDGRYACRPFTLLGSPKAAMEDGGTYEILVAQTGPGHLSAWAKENWKPGAVLSFGAPVGQFYHDPLRDGKHILAVCAGISPYLSMAEAIADGTEDFRLTILLLSPLFNAMPRRLASACERSGGKVKVVEAIVPGLPGPKPENAGREIFSAALLAKYITEDTTLFVNGLDAFRRCIDPEIRKLGLPKRRIRTEVSGPIADILSDPGFPREAAGKTFRIKVWARGEYREVECRATQPILDAIGNAGIRLTSDCRSGQCGWCHSRLIRGDYYMPPSKDGRREADRKFGWIHPCSAYPLSDMEMEIFPVIGLDK